MTRILITGANGHLGLKLLAEVGRRAGLEARLLVRSEGAAAKVKQAAGADANECRIARFDDLEALAGAVSGCEAVVHLVGIIKESPTTSYESAHEGSCKALLGAIAKAGEAGIAPKRIVYLSILGSSSDSTNACLSSKGRAEKLLLDSPVDATVLRVPMVLGPGDIASKALAGQARAPFVFWIGGGKTLQQPIDAGDVVSAILAAIEAPDVANRILELGGPECLSHRELVTRAAALHGRRPRGVPVPSALVGALARLTGSGAMFEILQHDDRVDPEPATEALGIHLTPLAETLRRCVGPEAIDE